MNNYIDKTSNTDNYEFSIIHGDLCFSNILVEGKLYFTRLIDPRGRFGKFDIFGDGNYDFAKLLHSIDGGYDYIISDLFELEINDKCYINFNIKRNEESNRELLLLFYEKFRNHIQNLNKIRQLESLLFLSMLPLHKDHPKRQLGMLCTGVTLFFNSFSEE